MDDYSLYKKKNGEWLADLYKTSKQNFEDADSVPKTDENYNSFNEDHTVMIPEEDEPPYSRQSYQSMREDQPPYSRQSCQNTRVYSNNHEPKRTVRSEGKKSKNFIFIVIIALMMAAGFLLLKDKILQKPIKSMAVIQITSPTSIDTKQTSESEISETQRIDINTPKPTIINTSKPTPKPTIKDTPKPTSPPIHIINVALGKPTSQSSEYYMGGSGNAVDGNTDGNWNWSTNSVTHTNADVNAWWKVDLGGNYNIDHVTLWNRTDDYGYRLSNFHVDYLDSKGAVIKSYNNLGTVAESIEIPFSSIGVFAVKIQFNGTDARILSLAEVQVYGKPL